MTMTGKARTRFPVDRQLTARMLGTVFLLGLLYAAFTAALFVILGAWLPVILVAAALLFAQYWFSDRLALFAMRGHLVTAAEQPHLHAVVDRLCAAADMTKPGVAIADTDLPNAFATGRNPSHAVLCVTTGMIRRLDDDELEAVLAHELSHIAHRDVAVITVASFLGVLAGLLVRLTFYGTLFGGRGRMNNPAFLAAILGLMAVSAAVYSISFLLIRTLSRYRELAADRSGAILTGRPSVLASALTKLSGANARIPTKDLRTAQAFNAFFITPLGKTQEGVYGLLSTHPSLDVRLRQLADLATRLGEVRESD
jgi:heat shock protein HtpX